MPTLLILASNADEYARLIESANVPDLRIVSPSEDADIVLGEPRLIRDALSRLSTPKWIQSIYAGVESLMDPTLRRDYILTNARGVFGELMSEYVLGYLLAHEKKIFERYESQQAKKWDRFESGMLRGKTIGLLGVGSIGTHLAGMAKQFGMTVHGFTRESEASNQVDKYFHPNSSHSVEEKADGDGLIEFAKGLDYLVVVLPRTKDTNKIVDLN